MNPGDPAKSAPPPDTELKVLFIAYLILWLPVVAAVPFSIATNVVASRVYCVGMFTAAQPGAGPYHWIDILRTIAAYCLLCAILLWLATWIAGPIIVVLRIRRRLVGIKTPAVFWLLVFGPLLACPLAYIFSVIFISGH